MYLDLIFVFKRQHDLYKFARYYISVYSKNCRFPLFGHGFSFSFFLGTFFVFTNSQLLRFFLENIKCFRKFNM